jgi:hypothetical protein
MAWYGKNWLLKKSRQAGFLIHNVMSVLLARDLEREGSASYAYAENGKHT